MNFNNVYFRRYYPDYFRQNPPYKLRHYLRLLKKYARQGTILDIGCSYGLFVEMASKHFQCRGMDVSREVVAEASRRVPRATFASGKLPDIPFNGLEAVTLFDVLEHVEDLDATMEAVLNGLNPGGIALVVVPVFDGPLGSLVRRLDKDPTHIHKRSRAFWLELGSKHFELLAWHGIFRKLLLGRFYANIPTKLLRGIAPAIVMVLRKTAHT